MVEVSSQKVSFSWKKVVRKNKTLSLTFLQKCLFVEKRQCKKTLFSRFCLALSWPKFLARFAQNVPLFAQYPYK